ncbi:hypothetical protein CERZMDRAFT_108673 [Cercospora zeae-maydis SCOH1-5]|uniref:Peptidase A1 domain-containing protein n=1 Tax=Cercospora zeae-maydis SCOH1-5 TaxID=717836 RepID=A0A6A6FT87_9PEZI|nr:hypothetical protein CERZMDRAFT_108673 [Cercospora zeae-maydis SCOH1-5]
MTTNITIPAPISWTPSSFWDGNDGTWNSFIVQVGTPPQEFRILPSTADQETWIPVSEGCTAASPDNPGYCGYLRGTLPVNGVNSSGFATNETSSWEQIGSGIYTLNSQEAELGYGGNGLYGFDTVVWGDSSSSPSLARQVVAGIADPSFWLGIAGIGPKPINFTEFNDPIDSFLSTLVKHDKIGSLSWAYTAGASYRDQSPASLTLGGYDRNRIQGTPKSFAMNADNSRPLQVAVTAVTGQSTLDGTISLWESATMHFIDSTVPHIWVPEDSIELWTSAFGLTYDNTTDLYVVNETTRDQLLELNPTITFTLGATMGATVSDSQTIRLPYAAFDLEASYPFYQNATRYFPIRRAANNTQYTIGRTFFQEAYVIADFGRSNFTVAQASFDNLDTERLVAIDSPPVNSTFSEEETSPSGLGGGAIAGIVVGAVAGLAIIASLLCKVMMHQEMESPFMRSEVSGDPARWGKNGVQELHTPPIPGNAGYGVQELGAQAVGHESGFLAEAPGTEGTRAELPGSEPVDRK